MSGITATMMDKSLIVGAVILGLTMLGGIFHFIRLALYSAGMEKKQAGIVSIIILLAIGFVIYQRLFQGRF